MILKVLGKIFTWWNGATIGTWFTTLRKGVKVGEDDQGNIYYRDRKNERRWVIYDGEAEASRVPPEWHRWLHHTCDEPPSEVALETKAWEKPHEANPTGTSEAYYPPGSLNDPRPRQAATGDYEAWQPE